MRWCLALMMLGCGSTATSSEAEGTEEPGSGGDVQTVEPSGSSEAEAPGEAALSIRVELENPVIPANADPARDERARLNATLYVRNDGAERVTVDTVIPAAHELEWTLTGRDGAVWRPTFLPPGVPRPGGPPRTTVTVEAGAEARVADLHGISGFYREPRTGDAWGPLPTGVYDVLVSDVRLGDDAPPLTAPAVRLEVR